MVGIHQAMISVTDLSANLAAVRSRIGAACARAGRDAGAVSLLPVTKMHPPEVIAALMELGIDEVGENRVQELQAKDRWFAERGGPRPRWHMVGTLQRNKVKHLLTAEPHLIHSVDSAELAGEIERQAERRGIAAVRCLLEVNVSGEESKHGLRPSEIADTLRQIRCEHPRVRIEGLMTMAPWEVEPEQTRSVFRALRTLRNQLQEELDCPLPELSMGMTNDFEVAVEEGATVVRVGTAIFGSREEENHG